MSFLRWSSGGCGSVSDGRLYQVWRSLRRTRLWLRQSRTNSQGFQRLGHINANSSINTVSCLKCGSFKLKVIGEFDSDASCAEGFPFLRVVPGARTSPCGLPPLKQFRLLLDFVQRRPVGIFQDRKPIIAEPCAKLLRPQDEGHPVVIRRNAGVGRRGQHREPAALRVRLPQASHRKQQFTGLNETDAFFKKAVGQNQAAVSQVRLERGQLGDGFALGIDERLFVPRHAPAPGHLPAGETFLFRNDDRSQVGGPDVAARHKAENEDLVAQL